MNYNSFAFYFLFFVSIFISSNVATADCVTINQLSVQSGTTKIQDQQGRVRSDLPIVMAQFHEVRIPIGEAPKNLVQDSGQNICVLKTWDVVRAFDIGSKHTVLLETNEGSQSRYEIIDVRNCLVQQTLGPRSGGSVADGVVTLDGDCGECEESGDFSGKCHCQSAQVWQLKPSCEFVKSDNASVLETKRTLGVGFLGRKIVRGARSDQAHIE